MGNLLHERKQPSVESWQHYEQDAIYTVLTHTFGQQPRVTSIIVKHRPGPAKTDTALSAERPQ